MFVLILLASYTTLCKCMLDTKIEAAFIRDIRYSLGYEKVILNELKRFRDSIQDIHNRANQDQYFLEDPFNNFRAVKRMILDWHYIAALSTFHKFQFLRDLLEDARLAEKRRDFPKASELKDIVLRISQAQEKNGVNSVSEFVMTLTNDLYPKLTGSDYFIFAEILNAVNKSTLGKQWKVESEALLTLTKDPVMESQDLAFIVDRTILLR